MYRSWAYDTVLRSWVLFFKDGSENYKQYVHVEDGWEYAALPVRLWLTPWIKDGDK